MINYQTYRTGPHEEILVMELSGRLDEHTADFLVESLKGWVDRDVTQMVLDCSELEHVTSFGLAALVRVHARVRKVGGSVVLAAVPGLLADVLRVVHFEKLFHLYDDVDQAVESFAPRSEA